MRIMDFRLPKKELAKVKEFSILDLDKIVLKKYNFIYLETFQLAKVGPVEKSLI